MSFLDDGVLAHLRSEAGAPDLSGTRYELRGTLGRGGMGTVYSVLDRELQREVALKVLDHEPTDTWLLDEARVVARLEHPGIVPVHDVGRLGDGRLYLTMKLVRGERLDRWSAGPRSLAERVVVVQRLCEAAAFAHAHGVIHRDLKPANVMVGEFGEVLVMDFGVALRRDPVAEPPGDASAPGRVGVVAGTQGFMAPEQQRGDAAIDARADVYGLGAILRFLVAGAGAGAAVRAPAPLTAIVAHACAEAPAARYPGPLELADDLRRWLSREAVVALPEGLWDRSVRLAVKYRTPLLLVLAYVVVRAVLLLAGGA